MGKRRSEAGRITRGIVPDTLAMKTLAFVQQQLPRWRDTPNRPEADAEEELNSQLCKHLNVVAPREFPMVHFSHEERQPGRRRVDLAANPVAPTVIAGKKYSEFDPFLMIEGKRLPAPSKDREREYVTGFEKRSGGIQRFKLGLHGSTVPSAAIVGYVQRGNCGKWFHSVNEWISELGSLEDEVTWNETDLLQEFVGDSSTGSARCFSMHSRSESSSLRIHLTHLWIEMKRRVNEQHQQ